MICRPKGGMLSVVRIFCSRMSTIAPAMVPTYPPLPPASDVPPITTAMMDGSMYVKWLKEAEQRCEVPFRAICGNLLENFERWLHGLRKTKKFDYCEKVTSGDHRWLELQQAWRH